MFRRKKAFFSLKEGVIEIENDPKLADKVYERFKDEISTEPDKEKLMGFVKEDDNDPT